MVGQRRFFLYFIIQEVTVPLDLTNIKYLLSAKSLLQSLNLVHLQFLEQRTDLGMREYFFVFRNAQKYQGGKKSEELRRGTGVSG